MSRAKRLLSSTGLCLAIASFGCTEKPPASVGTVEQTPAEVGGGSAAGDSETAGESHPSGEVGSPRATMLAAQRAMKARDFGALFDLLSAEAQERFRADLEADAKRAADVPFAKDILGYDPAEVAKLPSRDAFVRIMAGGIAASDKLARSIAPDGAAGDAVTPAAADAEIVGVETEGEAATVALEYRSGPLSGQRGKAHLVLDGGSWRLTEFP